MELLGKILSFCRVAGDNVHLHDFICRFKCSDSEVTPSSYYIKGPKDQSGLDFMWKNFCLFKGHLKKYTNLKKPNTTLDYLKKKKSYQQVVLNCCK